MNQIEENTESNLPSDLEVKKTPPETEKLSPKRFCWVGYIILLIVVMAAGAGGYCAYEQWKIFDQRLALLEQHMGQTESVLEQRRNVIDKLSQAYQEREDDQLNLEVENILNAAVFNLTFSNNIGLARQLLETADKQIAETQSAEWIPLREALARDIAALNAAAFDLPGVAARLSALQQEALNLANLRVSPEELSEKTSATKSVSQQNKTENWSTKLLESLKDAFSNIVFISKDAQIQPALLTKDQRLYLISNIQSELLMAQWAAIQRQSSVYQQSLSQIEIWLKQYFPEQSSVVQSMLKSISELKSVPMLPVPRIDNTLQVLQKIRTTS